MNWIPRKSDALFAGSPITFETCRDTGKFRALQAEWDELFERANGEYFQSFEYCHGSLMAEHVDTRRKLHCIVGRRDGRLVVVWPLLASYRSCWKFAEPLAPLNQSPSDILVAPERDAAAIVEAAWRNAIATTRADVFELWHLRQTSLLHACLSHNGVTARAIAEYTPFSALRDVHDWDAYCRSRPARERNAPEYLKRRMAKQGKYAIQVIDPADERMLPLIEWFVVQKRKWAGDKATPSEWTFSDASPKLWSALLARRQSTPGMFRLFVLTLNGQPVAANIVAIASDTAYLVANTYDLDQKKLSPGTILVDECVKWAFEHRLDFDFGSGEQRYKTSWSAGEKYATSSLMVIATAWGQTGYMSKQFVKKAREGAMRVVSRVVRKADATAASD
ncbi:hypothetical protein AWB79_05525 [Caballeronia hypogeia]|uniref:BioF2-like acetyltransferase domain-containing protein n=1 Tax=Caballeronia hypogeia TaxID=1777140 RepID=A0A158CKE8_9BURK|nr:GNAT family N-acetyltransferase [Caballeronia hypogeia]SAK82761.1 hypothetical protein AWB79_05525 [Caballeronia hypogeia]